VTQSRPEAGQVIFMALVFEMGSNESDTENNYLFLLLSKYSQLHHSVQSLDYDE